MVTLRKQRAAEDLQTILEQQIKLERWADQRVKPWSKLQPDDYDFRSWTKGASKELLEAGCIYEYARESRRLRCLVALMDPARRRMDFELSTLTRTGIQLKRPCEFEGLRQENVRATLGYAIYWLAGLADELADNKSFAELFRTRRAELKESIAKRPLRFPRVQAVGLGLHLPGGDPAPPWPWSFRPWYLGKDLRARNIPDHGREPIAVSICWRDFSDQEIGEAMKKFASAHRPEAWKKPRRDELKKSLHSDVKALSVMRIWKRFPKRQHLPNRMIEVAKCTGYKACVEEAAAYKERCKEGRGDEPMSGVAKVEMSSARKQARDFFQQLFPGELPLNW